MVFKKILFNRLESCVPKKELFYVNFEWPMVGERERRPQADMGGSGSIT